MKSWRERIAEARERGALLREDYALAMDFKTCAVGGCVNRYGVEVIPVIGHGNKNFCVGVPLDRTLRSSARAFRCISLAAIGG
jgi:hypothetical protein